MKTCNKCKTEKTENEFHKDKSRKDGLRRKCKKCAKEYDKAWYDANKDRKKEYDKAYRETHKEQKKEYRKAYHEANKRKNLFKAYKKNAKQRGIPFEISETDFYAIASHECHYCGTDNDNGVDRIDSKDEHGNKLAYNVGNVVPCCTTCNIMKQQHPYAHFIAQIEKIYNHLTNK